VIRVIGERHKKEMFNLGGLEDEEIQKTYVILRRIKSAIKENINDEQLFQLIAGGYSRS
jgi:hypothetical protein